MPYKDKEKAKAYREANKENIKAYNKAYYEADKEKKKAASKAYREANPEKIKATRKAYEEANKEKIKVSKKAYREANKENIKDYSKAYYEKNKEKIKIELRAYREANPEKVRAKNKAYYQAHKEEVKVTNKAKRAAWKGRDPYEENEKNGITEKACSQCKRELPIRAFPLSLVNTNGLNGKCKDCAAYANSKRRKGRHTLTREYFFEVRQKPCTFCGKEATLIEPNGVDRIDSSKGYTKNNVQPCCEVCNRMKLDHSHEFFIKHSKRMLEHLGYIIMKKGQQTLFGD